MPRLSDYIAARAAAASSTAAASPAAATAATHQDATSGADAALAAEVARMQRQYQHRLQEHGPRLYRHEDGSLQPQPPAKQPYTVANRRKWHGLVQRCLKQPRVDQQLERTGVSARQHVNTSFEQHEAALAAIGLQPEYDAAGSWHGFDAARQDPLAPPAAAGEHHPLTRPEWGELTKSVLDRAVELYGEGIIERDAWQSMRSAVQGKGSSGS